MTRRTTTLTCSVIIMGLVFFGYLSFQTSHAQTAVTTISGKFYKLEVLATNGISGITTINSSSINDSGTVAFNTANAGLFIADGRTPLRNITGGDVRAPQITNNNQVIYRATSFPVNTGTLLRRDTTVSGNPATIIAGESSTAFPDFSVISDFPSINNSLQAGFSAVTTVGQVRTVTGIRTSFNQQPVSPSGALFDAFPVVGDNGNVVLRTGANGASANQNVILYSNYNLSGTPINIAAGANFNALGRRPGISDDGSVIVFYGDITTTGATAIQTTPGPGIFANYDIGGGTRRTVRIARRQVENFFGSAGNQDGICDLPEQTGPPTGTPPQPQCVDGELGLDALGNPLQFASFSADARVGVVHQDLAPLGNIEGDSFVVSFIGTPNAASTAPQYFSNQLGLWTIKVDVKRDGINLREKPSRPMSVIQVGDLIGAGNQVATITVHDPIALAATDATGTTRVQRPPDHRVVFSATTQAGGNILVRGTHIDSDEDGLPDHWETSGIDFDQDGTLDLALNTIMVGDASNLAANPKRKDVYVEMDYMQETTGANPHTHQPGRRPDNSANLTVDPILQVRNAFSSNPVRNLDGSFGATLHTFMGEAVPEVFGLQFLYQTRPTGGQDDFDDLKFGSNGATPGVPCGNGSNDGHFGTMAERGNATTCTNVLGAKRLVFRYCIFAHRVTFPPTTPDFTSGVAEIGGNDFIVSLAVREPIIPVINPTGLDYEDYANSLVGPYNSTTPAPSPVITFDSVFADYQAGTFMHELGHTLGLLHGGKDIINCKPNYLSVMNYSRQTNARGISTIDLPGIAPSVFVLTNRRLDYARNLGLRTLDESSLLETAGIRGPTGERTLHGGPTTGTALISSADGAIDWNNNGSNDTGTISADVNFLPTIDSAQCTNSPSQTLESSDDWSNLRFNHFETINFADGSQRTSLLDGKDLDLVAFVNLGLGNVDIDTDGVVNFNDNCIFAPNSSQSDGNSNGVGDACDSLTTSLADVSVTIDESADPVQINTPFDYIATIKNDGASPANSVVFTSQIPANTIFVSVTPDQGSCSGTASINCNVGTIASGATATVTIRVTPTVVGKLDDYANTNSESVLDPNILNNTGSASTTIFNPVQTFTISGTVTDINGIGVSGVTIGFDGTQQGNASTDGSGNYSLTVASGGIYNLMPSKYGFAFTPPSRTSPYIASNQTLNFTALNASAVISGRVLTNDGRSIRNVRVSIVDAAGNTVGLATTSSFGLYTLGAVAIDQTYVISAEITRYTFTPRTVFVFEDLSNFDFFANP